MASHIWSDLVQSHNWTWLNRERELGGLHQALLLRDLMPVQAVQDMGRYQFFISGALSGHYRGIIGALSGHCLALPGIPIPLGAEALA